MVLGILYFTVKFIVDCITTLTIFKSEIESSGELVHNASVKVLGLLIFYQLCVLIKLLSGGNYTVSIILAVLVAFTISVYTLYLRPFIRPDMFKEEDHQSDDRYLRQWYNKYSHPMIAKAHNVEKPIETDLLMAKDH